MPTSSEFEKGFNLFKGLFFDDCKLVDIFIVEHTINKYDEYEYDIKLKFNCNHYNIDNLLKNIDKYTKSRIIYTKYGNPYKCIFSTKKPTIIENKNNIILNYSGHSKKLIFRKKSF